jgi:hypothetical protein
VSANVSNQHLGVYLNDHLAGSSAALELLAELGQLEGFKDWASRLRSEIAADRQELEKLMRSADITESSARKAAAWLTEKLAELKTRLDDRPGGLLQRLELIEALALGIEGKRALWMALQSVAAQVPALQGLNYADLIARATEQRRDVEVRRLQAAADALRPQ